MILLKNLRLLLEEGRTEEFFESIKREAEFRVWNTRVAGMEKEDLIQEVLLQVFQSIDKYDSSRAAASTYFGSVINNKIRDLLRKAGTNQNLSNTNAVAVMEEYSEELGGVILHSEEPKYNTVDLRLSLKKLDSRESKIVLLKAKGYTFQEIASRTGCSKSRAQQVYASSLAKLKEMLAC